MNTEVIATSDTTPDDFIRYTNTKGESIVIHPDLIPSPDLIKSSESRKNVPRYYNEDDDFFYQKIDADSNNFINLSKNQRKKLRKKLNKRNRINIQEERQIRSVNHSSSSTSGSENIKIKKLYSNFLPTKDDTKPFDLNEWKQNKIKVELKDNFGEALHQYCETTEVKKNTVPFSGIVPYELSEPCNYKGFISTCTHIIKLRGEIPYNGTITHENSSSNHKCLCFEVEELTQELLKEQQKNSDLRDKYDKLFDFAEENI